jgi:hypothetical protein
LIAGEFPAADGVMLRRGRRCATDDSQGSCPLRTAGLIGYRALWLAGEQTGEPERIGIYGFGAAASTSRQPRDHICSPMPTKRSPICAKDGRRRAVLVPEIGRA